MSAVKMAQREAAKAQLKNEIRGLAAILIGRLKSLITNILVSLSNIKYVVVNEGQLAG